MQIYTIPKTSHNLPCSSKGELLKYALHYFFTCVCLSSLSPNAYISIHQSVRLSVYLPIADLRRIFENYHYFQSNLCHIMIQDFNNILKVSMNCSVQIILLAAINTTLSTRHTPTDRWRFLRLIIWCAAPSPISPVC